MKQIKKFNFENVSIIAQGLGFPENKITSDEIEEKLSPLYERLHLPKGRLELMTGIKERFIGGDEAPSKLAIKVARSVIDQSGVLKDEIDLLIYASVCRDFLEPATSSVVHNALSLPASCEYFDLSNACLGVLNGMVMAGQLIEHCGYRKILIVGSENSGPLLRSTIEKLTSDQSLNRKNIKKYIASLTIGSGAYAVIMGTDHSGPQLRGGTFLSNTDTHQLCQGGGDLSGMLMETDSEELLHKGVELAKENWAFYSQFMGERFYNADHFITHQVGPAHEEKLFKELVINKNKSYPTYPFWGNTGSVALPLTLAKGHLDQRFKKGETISLLGIGSGLGSYILGVVWN